MHGGRWYDALQQGGLRADGWLDLSSSISPYGPGPAARRIWSGLIDGLDRYPDPDYRELRVAVGRHYGVPAEQVTMTNGAMEAIDILYRALTPPKAAVFIPAFSEYLHRGRAYGVPVTGVTTVEELPLGPGLVFLANPANPTGDVWDPDELWSAVQVMTKRRWIVVIDEAFLEFLPDWRERTMMAQAARSDQVVVIQSLTKFYGLAGLRLGFLAAGPSLVQRWQRWLLPWQVNGVAAQVARAALEDQAYFQSTRQALAREREELARQLGNRGKILGASAANFLLVEPHGVSVDRLIAGLWAQGILVRDARSFPGLSAPAVRLAVKRPRDSYRLLSAWDAVLLTT